MANNGPKHALDALGAMLPLKWRGIEVPSQVISLTGGQRCTEHNQYGVQGGITESGGRSSSKFAFRIPCRAGIVGYKDLYPLTFRSLVDALLDSSVGPLQHPEFGELDARVFGDFTISWDPNKRDGADIDATFIEHVDGRGLEGAGFNADQFGVVGTLEAQARDLGVEADDGSGSSLTELANGIAGRLALAQLSVQDQLTKIANLADTINNMVDALESIASPSAWGVSDGLKNLLASLDSLAKEVAPPGKRKRIATKEAVDTASVSTVASRWNMSSDDFLALNPSVGLTGKVKAGEEFFVFEVA